MVKPPLPVEGNKDARKRKRAAKKTTAHRRSIPNAKNNLSRAEYTQERQDLAEGVSRVMKKTAGACLSLMAEIPDPRQKVKVTYPMADMMTHGMLMFALRNSSRREANVTMTSPVFTDNICAAIPGLGPAPHMDSLKDLLKKMDVEQIQENKIRYIKGLMRDKKLSQYTFNGKYLVAVDGSQKYTMDRKWHDEALVRHVGQERKEQFYVYVLEASLILSNGASIPIYTDILENDPNADDDSKQDGNSKQNGESKQVGNSKQNGDSKQDCELKAFYRLEETLKKIFRRGKMILVADALYTCGPVMDICRKNGWEHILTLKPKDMPELWSDVEGLGRSGLLDTYRGEADGRSQTYQHVNGLKYGPIKRPRTANVMICREMWTEHSTDETGPDAQKETMYSYLTSFRITEKNVKKLCRMGRRRWCIESEFHVEKHQGYEFEHVFSMDWNAMKGFHYLMRLAHTLNVLLTISEVMAASVLRWGISGFLRRVNDILHCDAINAERLREAACGRFMWRLNPDDIFRVEASTS